MEYNDSNLELVSNTIRSLLAPDLLPKRMNSTWEIRAKKSKWFGHCHTASAVLRRIFGKENITLYRGLDDSDIYHWWAEDLNGNRIDLTSEQYTDHGLQPPYEKAEKSSPLGFSSYRKRVDLLEQRVLAKLNGESAITFE